MGADVSPDGGAGIEGASASLDGRAATIGDSTTGGPGIPQDTGTVTARDAASAARPDGDTTTAACATGMLSCGGVCVSPTDVHNCGACARDCTQLANVSGANLACSNGRCVYQCVAGYADCGDAGAGCLASIAGSPNCGACGTTCAATSALCAPSNDAGAFACASSCPASAPTLCGGSCVDEQSNPSACGGCGAAYVCQAGSTCRGGRCGGPMLTITPNAYAFPTTTVDASSPPQAFVVSNVGTYPSDTLSASLGGTDALQFLKSADGCSGTALAAGASCTISVQFAPTSRGPKSALVAPSGATLNASLAGSGRDFVALTVTKSGSGSGTVLADQIACGTTCTEQVERSGSVDPVITLVASPDANSVFSGWSGACTGTSPMCNVTMSQAQAVGAKFDVKTATLTLTERVFGASTGTGMVVSSPAGIGCVAPCTQSAAFPLGTTLTLTASGGFQVWWGPKSSCSGLTCPLTLTADRSLTVTFAGNNFVFASSTMHDAALGGPTGADAMCNSAAVAAGLPGHYIAWIATTTSNPATRLANARGWLRTDGLPFADTVAGLAIGRVYYPPNLDELGQAAQPYAMTGAYEDGTVVASPSGSGGNLNCADFTSNSGAPLSLFALGDTRGGSVAWSSTGFDGESCASQAVLLCFGTDLSRPVTLTPAPGRHAFVSQSVFTPGGGLATADALCRSEATTAGLANPSHFQAMLATSTATAVSRFDLTKSPWIRIDGLPIVKSASDLTLLSGLTTSISQFADGTYVSSVVAVFTGAANPDNIPLDGATCNDWTSNSPSSAVWSGYPITTTSEWFGGPETPGGLCSQPLAVYCFEN